LEEGAERIFFFKKLLRGRKRGKEKNPQLTPNSRTVRFPSKNPERDFLDVAFVGAGSLKPEPT